MPSLREEITKTFLRLTARARRGNLQTEREESVSPSSADELETVVQPNSHEGEQLGAYRILKRLGFGGMGHVYLALDTRLGRHVALKFLSPELTADENMLRRLQQEARTASALNHPNILTIYEIGESHGEHFIASEFVDGATLRTAMERGAIDVATALDIARQVASALVAAHSAGVVHRDLKPGNIMIRSDGYVKIIDFGLAKQYESAVAGSPEMHVTRPGAVVGTVSYMSPEQARGERVDHRTDLWSLGVILYEMVAHRRPFEGPTDSHVMVAIFDRAVPPLPATGAVPAGLSQVIERALAKNREKRYQTAGEMVADLQQLSQASRFSSRIRSGVIPNRIWRWKSMAIYAGAIVLLLATAVWWWPMGGKDRVFGPDWFRIDSVRQLTFNGRTNLACISPDGKYLAFVTGDPDGLQTLYLKQVNSGSEEIKIPPKRINYVGITFSPDDQLFVVEKDQALMGRLYALPIVGQPPSTPILVDVDGPVTFSPDGRQFAFVRYIHHGENGQTESAIFVASRDGAGRKLISIRDSTMYQCIAWSPAGNRIAAILFSDLPGQSDRSMLDMISTDGHERRHELPNWRLIGQPWWTPDGKAVILSAANRTQARNQAQLREIAVDTGAIEDLTTDLAGYKSVSITRDGLEMTATKLESRATLWISAENDLGVGESAAAEAEENPSLSWYGPNNLIVNSQRGGFPNLWLFDINTQTRTDFTDEPFIELGAAALPNSKSVVFASNRTGQFKIWRFDHEANRYTQLTFGPNYDEAPVVSPDGRWIVYTSWTSAVSHLRRVSANGGESVPVGDFPARYAQISPDGKLIACQMRDPATSNWTVAIFPFDGSGAVQAIPTAHVPLRWSPDGRALTTVITNVHGTSNIWSVPLNHSAPRQLTHFDEQVILNLAWSPGGDRLACVRAISGSDVVLFRGQKPQ